jgi:hypothetical protein
MSKDNGAVSWPEAFLGAVGIVAVVWFLTSPNTTPNDNVAARIAACKELAGRAQMQKLPEPSCVGTTLGVAK